MGIDGVINIDRIDQLQALADQSQTPGLAARQHTGGQLRIVWPPDQVGAQCHGAKFRPIGRQHQPFSRRFGGRIGCLEMRCHRQAFISAFDITTGMDNRRCAGVDQPPDAMLSTRRKDIARPQHVGPVIIIVSPPNAGLRGDVNDCITALGCLNHRLTIGQIDPNNIHTQGPQRRRIVTLQRAHSIAPRYQMANDCAAEKAAASGDENQASFPCAQTASFSRPILAL